MATRIADVAPKDRPRERLARLGASRLTDAELVALIIRSGTSGCSALELGQDLIARAGGLGALGRRDLAELQEEAAIGTAKACSLIAAFELGRRAGTGTTTERARIRSPEDVVTVVRQNLFDPGREELVVVVLSSASRVVHVQHLTSGTSERCLMDASDVLSVVLRHKGSAFVVAHSHPSGDTRASAADLRATEKLAQASRAVGLRFLGHLIVGADGWAEVPFEGLASGA